MGVIKFRNCFFLSVTTIGACLNSQTGMFFRCFFLDNPTSIRMVVTSVINIIVTAIYKIHNAVPITHNCNSDYSENNQYSNQATTAFILFLCRRRWCTATRRTSRIRATSCRRFRRLRRSWWLRWHGRT